MVTAIESKAQLRVLTDDAADTAEFMLRRTSGRWESRRLQLLDTLPGVVAYYSEGSSALAADLYDDARDGVVTSSPFRAEPVVLDRVVRIRRGVAWASEPLSVDDDDAARGRLLELTRSEVVRPYRDTVITNRRQDPDSAGWVRITSGAACGFCKMLAAKGAVYKKATAYFAAHDSCTCTCAPVFRGGEQGPEASVIQYIASKRRRTEAEKARVREWVAFYEDQ